MLLNDFYTLQSFSFEDEIKAEICLNQQHPIFDGHFPGQPIVPGVCMVQMVKETLEKALNRPLFLKNGTNIKFIAFIDPNQHTFIQLSLKILSQEDEIKVRASIYDQAQTFFKFSGSFVEV